MAPARRLGARAIAIGLETLDLARVHERAAVALVAPGDVPGPKKALVRRAGAFFAEALAPIEKTHRAAREANIRLNGMIARLIRHRADLAASNRRLKREIAQRKAVEESLRKSERHYGELLAQSHHLQEQLRHLSREILSAQEEERKRISRELHDQIAQTLTGINLRLATLKTEATSNTKDLRKRIAGAQRMVEKSVDIVHRFARELRPTGLDDLGLTAALQGFAKGFSQRTRVRVRLTVCAAVEKLDHVKRTALYRVAQEALTNVARHARASEVDIGIHKLPREICLTVNDNGKAFDVERVLLAKKNRRLGLLGMRERVEMVGGSFTVVSAPGHGTTIRARIPVGKGGRK